MSLYLQDAKWPNKHIFAIMTIVINTSIAVTTVHDMGNRFIIDCFSKLAVKYPEHHFLFIVDKPLDKKYLSTENTSAISSGPSATHPILWNYWYNFKLPSILKKYKATVYFGVGGIVSLRTKIPQCILVQDLSFMDQPQFVPKKTLDFFKRYMPKFLDKAKFIVTFSQFTKSQLITKYNIPASKMHEVGLCPDPVFKPVSASSRENLIQGYTQGREYFLYAGATHPRNNLVNLLKAFSYFKKRLKSNMLLIIAGDNDSSNDAFKNLLTSYKFKDEVIFFEDLEIKEKAKLMSAAYAFVYPSYFEDLSVLPLEAIQCAVPVITGNKGALPEICGAAAMYANSIDFYDLADKMMLVFKDEDRKNALIKEGEKWVSRFMMDESANQIWNTLLACLEEQK